ncbi:MAG: prolyl oligopeptidase family serine peptidase, partial [Terriglobales bacterium]
HLNSGVKATWGESRSVHWAGENVARGKMATADMRVQGWLMLPANYDPARKYPLVVSVHGGPSWACTSKWSSGGMAGMTAASLLDWFVLCPNPRGSFGQGEAFAEANVKDFGGGDYRDIMAGIDAVAKQFPIDRKRIGIRGHSYGGYMTMWAETKTHFAAAVAGAGLSDWQSYYGLNDIDEWMIPFFGASIYDDPAVYLKSDPIHFVKNVTTPTLILVGDSDGEVPMEQSLEWYHALQSMKVPSEMVVYPNEGHVFYKHADARDYSLRMLRWLDEWFAKSGE